MENHEGSYFSWRTRHKAFRRNPPYAKTDDQDWWQEICSIDIIGEITMTSKIHSTANISSLADIEHSIIEEYLEIGSGSTVDSFVKFKPAGGTGKIIIGNNCYINSGCVFYSGNGIAIGNDVLIASNCTLAPTNHSFEKLDQPILTQRFQPSRGGIVIQDNVWIGANCVILDGAFIETGCVVAAGSLVRQRLKTDGVYAGTPARLIRKRG